MPRVKLQFDGPELFTATFVLGSRDINYGGHLGNDQLVTLLQEARIHWLRELGYTSELEIEGAGWIQADLQVQYLKEAFLGDTIHISLGVTDIHTRGFSLLYKVSKEDQVIALACTNMLFMDYASRMLISIPPNFKNIISPAF